MIGGNVFYRCFPTPEIWICRTAARYFLRPCLWGKSVDEFLRSSGNSSTSCTWRISIISLSKAGQRDAHLQVVPMINAIIIPAT
jgi:hypothetical protein